MARPIRVRVVLNKGRHGVPLRKLPSVLDALQAFLDNISSDLGIADQAGWQGLAFKDGSLDFIAQKNTPVEEPVRERFNTAARNVILNRPDDRISRNTRAQYARIAQPIDPDEKIDIGLERASEAKDDSAVPEQTQDGFTFFELSKQTAESIQRSIKAKVRSLASVQGIIHSVFIEAEQPHFQLRELSSQNLISCTYSEGKYDELADALKRRRAVVHVHGLAVTDTLSRKIDTLLVDHIEVASVLDSSFLDRFIGCAPGLVSESDLQEFIGNSRERGD